MRVALLLSVIVACGPGLRGVDPKQATQDALSGSVDDVAAMTRLVRGSVVNAGVWFADPACAKLPRGEIAPSLHAELARCLVALHLTPSKREDALGDVAVMRYAPGFEVELRVVQDADGPRLTWIGPEGMRAQDTLPTIGSEAFEALRIAGDRDGPLTTDAAAAATAELAKTFPAPKGPKKIDVAFAWFKVCIDETGALTAIDPYVATSVETERRFMAAATEWKFKPFTVAGRAMPVCAMSRLVYPPGRGAQPERIPMSPPPPKGKKRTLVVDNPPLVNSMRISGGDLVGPDPKTRKAIKRTGSRRVAGTYRVCADETGVVVSVMPVRSTGYPAYDARMMSAMQQGHYSPFLVDSQPVPVCHDEWFILQMY